jgi:hypothetical protein
LDFPNNGKPINAIPPLKAWKHVFLFGRILAACSNGLIMNVLIH